MVGAACGRPRVGGALPDGGKFLWCWRSWKRSSGFVPERRELFSSLCDVLALWGFALMGLARMQLFSFD